MEQTILNSTVTLKMCQDTRLDALLKAQRLLSLNFEDSSTGGHNLFKRATPSQFIWHSHWTQQQASVWSPIREQLHTRRCRFYARLISAVSVSQKCHFLARSSAFFSLFLAPCPEALQRYPPPAHPHPWAAPRRAPFTPLVATSIPPNAGVGAFTFTAHQ